MQVNRIIYQFWTGKNEMSSDRYKALESIKNIPIQSVLLQHNDILEKILPEYPLHPIYPYLSDVHKADYLRCYFMHHFGGGYADIKNYSIDNNWEYCFDLINQHEEYDIIGMAENKNGTFPQYQKPEILKHLISTCYFIARPYSEFTTKWWNRLNKKLDDLFENTKNHPAEFPRDGIKKSNQTSQYPIRWAEILGEIVHELCYEMRNTNKISTSLNPGRLRQKYQ